MSGTEQNISKADLIEERKANLELPEQPPVASDWNSSDASTVNVGSGRDVDAAFSKGNGALREPATGASAARVDGDAFSVNTQGQAAGRQANDNLGGIPSDAVTRDAKNKTGVVDTTNPDKGYPAKNDPSTGL